jgi:hypothetical protein
MDSTAAPEPCRGFEGMHLLPHAYREVPGNNMRSRAKRGIEDLLNARYGGGRLPEDGDYKDRTFSTRT